MVSEYIVRRRGQRNSNRAILVSLCCFVLSFDSFASLARAASDIQSPVPTTTTTPTTQPQIQTASLIPTTQATPSLEIGANHGSEGRMFGLKTLGKLVKGSIGAKAGIESEESDLNAEGDESNSFDASIGFENQSKSSSSSTNNNNNNNNNNNDDEEDSSSTEIKGIAADLDAIESDIEGIAAHVPQEAVKHPIKHHKHHVSHHNNHGYNFNYGQQAGFQQPAYQQQPEYQQQGYQPAYQQGYQQGYQPAYLPTHQQQGAVYGDEGDYEVVASNPHHHPKKPKSHPKKKAKSVKYKPIKSDDKVIIFKVDEKDHHQQQQQCEVKSFHLKGREIIANLMQFIRLKREKVQNIGFGLLKPLQVIGPLFDPLNLRKLVRILSPFKIASSMIRAQIKLLRKFLSITLGGGISLSHGLSNIVPMPGPVKHFVNHLFDLTKAFSDDVDQFIDAIDSILANRD